MSEKYIGQVMMAGFNFAPRNSAFCNGQLFAINQNTALFSLLGTQYGGNGITTFALPDLRGRTPVGYASSVDPAWQPPSVQIAQSGGVENVTLLSTNLPAHTHTAMASTGAGVTRNPRNAVYGTTTVPLHAPSTGTPVPLNPQTLAPAGGNQPHSNMQPYAVINFCIALAGIYPSRN